jgi:large subunit ribosomal protein L4
MAVVSLYNINGEKTGTIELDPSLFGVEASSDLVHEAATAQMDNARSAIAHTKDRSDVRGGGRKPWKQKGTGRARHGSRNSPIWSGGGVTFGPRNIRNFSSKINKKAKRKALAMVLSDKVANEKFVAVEDFILKDGKTKELAAILEKLPVANKKTLIVLPPENKNVARAAQNIKKVNTLPTNTINVVDLLKTDYVLFSKDAIDQISLVYKKA